MIDGGELKRHFSDIVSAYATKNQSEVTLIDPFQLVDYRDRIIPEQMYPHFQLIMDKFKTQEDGEQIDFSDIPILEGPEDPTYSQQESSQEEYLTGDQRVERAMASEDPQGSD